MSANTISDIDQKNNDMTFLMSNSNVSIVNALRRTILSDIPILAFKTTPYEENKCDITVNTSRFNNEIIKQRISCIPVHIDDLTIPYENLEIQLNVKNNTSATINVTTEDFKIKDTSTDTFISQEEVKKIFPPNKLTKDFIQLLRLRPKLSETLKEEEINLTAKLSIVTPSENGCFNAVYLCSYNNLPDKNKIQEVWNEKSAELKSTGYSDTDVEIYKKNWNLLDAKRIFVDGSYTFKIKSLGIYNCTKLVKMACDILVNRFDYLASSTGFAIKDNETTMENSVDIVFENEDYSIGKMLEYVFYTNYYLNSATISYVSFYKTHPHNDESILRISFVNAIEKPAITQLLSSVCNLSSEIFKSIKNQF